ncbi:hypothetical protein KBP30_40665 [Streptomyces sp. Go40/10]|uniref:hypothetical protein n=1 Tax=Streptomyces sp. Go40/10 TaxID=2825844 RepID=UPI001E5F8A63|nr:hypothetical protein [Streptomyces sp. Go40/10]UFR07070.1 hypothetical protein KBP30_40665 [Streptomyces sp. Go40/10]
MDTTRRTILRGMAAAPIVATTGGLLVPETALAAPAKPTLTMSYDPTESARRLKGIRWLQRDRRSRLNAQTLPLPARGAWEFPPVPVDKVPDWPDPRETPLPAVAYGWSPRDQDAQKEAGGWYPQGITTYYDATGRNGTRMMVSWYNKKDKKRGARIALIDRRSDNPRYHYIRLVKTKPKSGGGFTAVPIKDLHAGGLAWYRNRLYVTDSKKNALLVFNTDDIFVSTKDDFPSGVREDPWVLPLSRTYRSQNEDVDLTFSQVAVDRTSLSSPFRRTTLIVNGWETAGESQNIGRWSFAYGPSGSLLTDGNIATAADVYKIHRGSGLPPDRGVQGAVTVQNTMYLSVSAGQQHGYLSTAALGANQEGTALTKWRVPRGPEDLSYDGHNRWMWSLGEWEGYRSVYAMRV